jgi:hypothetical protein
MVPTESLRCCLGQHDRPIGEEHQCMTRMRSLEFNVIARDISDGLRKSVRRQELEFPDGEMRELNDS